MDKLLPWPSRRERKASITAARGEKESSRRAAAHAMTVEDAIRQMAAQNHFAELIAADIIRRHSRGGGGGDDTG